MVSRSSAPGCAPAPRTKLTRDAGERGYGRGEPARERRSTPAASATSTRIKEPEPPGAPPDSAQPPASVPPVVSPVGPVGPVGVGAEGEPVAVPGSPVTAAGRLNSASAVPPNAPRLMRAPFGVGSAPTSSAGSPWSVVACGPG